MRDAGRIAGTSLAFALALTASCGDDDTTPPEQVSAELSIVVAHPDHPTIEYQLSCDDGDASISGDDVEVTASDACETLADPVVVDRLVLGAPADRVCAQVFGGPDTASITGVVDGVTVGTVVDRTDACMIEDWDELLGELLPPPRGPGDDEAEAS